MRKWSESCCSLTLGAAKSSGNTACVSAAIAYQEINAAELNLVMFQEVKMGTWTVLYRPL